MRQIECRYWLGLHLDRQYRYVNRSISLYGLVITIVLDCLLVEEFDESIKQADASLMELEAEWPAVVLEVGISKTIEKLYEDVNRWLDTKIVILIDV
jgi:hypothetical protein